mgnify:CR=1 FL=1
MNRVPRHAARPHTISYAASTVLLINTVDTIAFSAGTKVTQAEPFRNLLSEWRKPGASLSVDLATLRSISAALQTISVAHRAIQKFDSYQVFT